MFDDPAKIAEALAQLEQERERRINEKIDAGKAIRVPLLATTTTQDLEARKELKRRELNTDREIIFDTMVVNTGVPRAGPGEQSIRHMMEKAPAAQPGPEPPPQPVARVPDIPEPKRIMATIAPRDERDCGIVFEGSYTVASGMVHVADQDGRPLGSLPVAAGDNVELVACRLLRDKLGGAASDFYGRINYPKMAIH